MALNKRTINAHVRELDRTGKRSIALSTSLPGLQLVITKTGLCSWTLRYRFEKRRISFAFAYHTDGIKTKDDKPSLSEIEAIEEAIKLKAMIREGIDVADQANTRVGSRRAGTKWTVNDVFDYFLDRVARPKWREGTLKNIEMKYDRHVRHVFGHREWDGVAFKEWRNLFDGIVVGKKTGRPAPTSATSLAKTIKQAFGEALYSEKVTNPSISNIKISRIATEPKERDRVLNDYELGQVWHWCESADTLGKMATKILLSTAARTHELRVSSYGEWDLKSRIWTVPQDNSKNGKSIVRPIPEQIIPLISSQLDAIEANSKSEDISQDYMLGKLYTQPGMSATLNEISGKIGMSKWRAHDLRRSCTTHLYEMGLEPTIIESLLGHAQDKVRRTYNKGSMLDSKREVLAKWHTHLEECRDKYLELQKAA